MRGIHAHIHQHGPIRDVPLDGIIIADQLLLSLHLNHAHIRQYNIASITGVGEHAVILERFSTEQTWSHIVSWMLLFRLYLLPYYS